MIPSGQVKTRVTLLKVWRAVDLDRMDTLVTIR